MKFSFSEISGWVFAQWRYGDENLDNLGASGICHDTRRLKEGDVYLAIRGEIHDGHDFVKQAVERGAVGIIVEREISYIKIPQLIVPDSIKALWQIAKGVRSEWEGTVIGVTGSVGKTTVKEMLASVLSIRGEVAKTPGNWNNDIGLPLGMLAADRGANFFVFELGMNHPGEIEPLANLLKPDWALVTNVGRVHTEFFNSVEEIADEKASIFKHAQYALMDPNSEFFERMKKQVLGSVECLTKETFVSPIPGEHMVQNARFAATIGLAFGMTNDEIQRGLDSFKSAPMRWQKIERNGIIWINDAYNANPISMRASLSTFAQMPCDGRKFVVLGGMGELGKLEDAEHLELGKFVDSLFFDRVITIGELGRKIECKSISGIEKDECRKILDEQLKVGDTVFLKASRSAKLETILENR